MSITRDKIRPLFTWRSAIASPLGPSNPTTRHVLLTLSLHMNERGESCYPTTKQLAEETGLSERSVCTHLEQAEIDGWMRKRAVGLRGRQWKRHIYSPAIPSKVLNELQRLEALNDVQHDPQRGTEPHAQGTERGARGTEPDDNEALNDVQSSTSVSTPSSTTDRGRRRKTPATPAPQNFEITPHLRDWAESRGLSATTLASETESFLDHHRAVGNTFSDWDAAWRKWMRNVQKWNGGSREAHQRVDNSAIGKVRRANAEARAARDAIDGHAERVDG